MEVLGAKVRKGALAGTVAALGAAVLLYARGNYTEYFLKQPGLVFAGCMAAFLAYLPSLWVIRKLDRKPYPWALYAAIVLFMVFTAPLVSEVTWGVINMGVRYWQIVGLTEEVAKMLPVLLCLLILPGLVRNTREGLVVGGVAGLGFAIIEFGVGFALDNFPEKGWADLYKSLPARWALGTEMHVIWGATTGAAIGRYLEGPASGKRLATLLAVIVLVMVTHGAQDFMGKYIAPLSLGIVGGAIISAGVPEAAFYEGGPLFIGSMITGATINTILINILVLPILLHHIRSSSEKRDQKKSQAEAGSTGHTEQRKNFVPN